MDALDLFYSEEKPLNIADFNIFLQSSPPQITERTIYDYDVFNTSNRDNKLTRKKPKASEGCLNIRVYQLSNHRFRLYVLGKIKGKDLQLKKEIINSSPNNFIILSEKMRYTLAQSKNILKFYYQRSNLKSLEEHLVAFLPI
jgi:hypothetical protein